MWFFIIIKYGEILNILNINFHKNRLLIFGFLSDIYSSLILSNLYKNVSEIC